jgi:hypothetical protein
LIVAGFSRTIYRPITEVIFAKAITQLTGDTQKICPETEKVVTGFCH